ncbi:MAG: TraR/DksA C4-type zinc finger protein [Flavobacteriaceae bacterium]
MDQEALRDRFLTEIHNTEKKIVQYEELTQPIAPDNAIGRVSRMDAINNKGVMEAALRKARERLVGLNRHLEKLQTSDFGICVRCKNQIPLERIFMAPQSSFCVNCARK